MATDDTPTEQPSPLPEELPLVTLSSPVLFPGGVASIRLSTDSNIALLKTLTEDQDLVGFFYPSEDGKGKLTVGHIPRVGIAARLVQRLQVRSQLIHAVFHGLARVELLEVVETAPYLTGRVQEGRSAAIQDEVAADALLGKALESYERLVKLSPRLGKETPEILKMNVEQGPGVFSDLLAVMLDIPVEEQRTLLETLDSMDRLRRLIELTEQAIARVAVERELESKVQVQIEARQREHFLREQLRAIQESLGEAEGPAGLAASYLARIDTLPVEEDCREILRSECRRLSVLPDGSQDAALLRSYFDTVFSLPWEERTRDSLDLRRAERVLNANHHGVAEVKERILEYLATLKLKGRQTGAILCLAGPPGTGKTTLGRSVAEALGRRFIRISLGGVSDESEIRGHRKAYVGARPGKLISAFSRVGSKNPTILIDELDKIGRDFRGDPAAALLEVLDPEQNHAFMDRYLDVPFDLSETIFIGTANVVETIPPALRDRLEIITLTGYTESEKLEIGRRYIVPKVVESIGLPRGSVRFTRNALLSLIRGYTVEAGVRSLERRVSSICRKVARETVAAGQRTSRRRQIHARHVEKYLGPIIYKQEFAARHPEVGQATGLAWTASGGEILFVEAVKMAGSGNIEVTGHLGEVMQESVKTALSYVRARARVLEIPDEAFRDCDIHVNFPAAAIPKDGPSAGITVATCLASLFSGRPVRHDVAMTGEISLSGKILSVGGLKEKVLAAHRATIPTVILPVANRKDLPDLPTDVRRELRIVWADRVEEVWDEAIMPLILATDTDEAGAEMDRARRRRARSEADRAARGPSGPPA